MSYLFESFDDEDDSLFMSFSKFQALYFPGYNDDDSVWTPTKIRKKREKAQFEPKDRYKSSFYLKYIKPAKDQNIPLEKSLRNPYSRNGKLFRKRFRVPYSIFEFICLDIVEKGIYKSNYDGKERLCVFGRPPVDLEILVLGALRLLSSGVPFDLIEELTNVSYSTHFNFFKQFLKWGKAASEDKIHLPRNQTELDHIVELYDRLGLPGCAGSVDCVHLWWDKCPAGLLSQCKGKEGYPSLAFEVICSHTKKILSVSPSYYGTMNDKTISRYDPGIQEIRFHNDLLTKHKWSSMTTERGGKKYHEGAYFICDGGYLEWEELIPPYKHQAETSIVGKWSKHVESMRKDIECVFGILKKRFLILKYPVRVIEPKKIEDIFVTCCVLHNLLHDFDGYDDWEKHDLVVYDNDHYPTNNFQEYDGVDLITLGNESNSPENITRSQLREQYNWSDFNESGDNDDDVPVPSLSVKEKFWRRRSNLIEHYWLMTSDRSVHLHLR